MANIKTYFNTASYVNTVDDSNIIVVQTSSDASLTSMVQTTVGAIRAPLVSGVSSNATSLACEASRAKASEASLAAAINTERTRATGVESSLSSAISSAINSLDVSAIGESGKYIETVSEVDGKISATTKSFDTEITGSSSGVPSSVAVKNYVSTRINSLNGSVGGSGKLVQEVTEENGIVSGTTINLESSLTNSASAVPTSQAVYNKISSLNGSVGGNKKLVQSITESNGVITGTTVDIIDGVNESQNIPTSKAIYDKIAESLNAGLGNLDMNQVGADENYIKTVKQTDGQVFATMQAFDKTINSNASHANAPTTLATKNYTDTASSNINTRIDNIAILNPTTGVTGDGYFVYEVNRGTGDNKDKFYASKVKFYDTTLASGAGNTTTDVTVSNASYAESIKTAPNVTVVSSQVKRLDERINATNLRLTNTTAGPFGASGAFISSVQQTTGGYLTASSEAFLTSIPGTTGATGASIAPTADAVRAAINALNASSVGAAGSYISLVSEEAGKVSVESTAFDTYTRASGWSTAASNNNAPTTLAVENRVNEAKREILAESEAMTYIGAPDSAASLASMAAARKAAIVSDYYYNIGDTYIAKSDFNFEGTSNPYYDVKSGDMLVVNTNSSSAEASKNYFDIISGSKNTILFSGTSATKNNIPVFDSTSGCIIRDSGESITTITAKMDAASLSASYAASAAIAASTSASFADNGIQPYINEASVAASVAASYATTAGTIATVSAEDAASRASTAAVNAETAESGAQDSSRAAAAAAEGAQGSSNAANSAKEGAQGSSNAANSAKEGAQGSSNAAAAAAEGAQGSSEAATASANEADRQKGIATDNATAAVSQYEAASNAAVGAQDSSRAAATATVGAQGSSNAANTAAGGAQVSSGAAATAKSGAQGSSNAAATAAAGAQGSSNAAATAAGGAQNSSNAAATAATGAQGSSNAAALSANAAAGYAADAKAYASQANLEYIKNAAEAAAASASTYATNAGNSAVAASGSANAASGSELSAAQNAASVASFADYSNLSSIVEAATTSANTAADKATAASGSADTAANKAAAASGSADTAANKAAAASGSADTAANKAASATTSANTAADQAASATTSANTAANKATAASGSADTAANKAAAASGSADTAANKAAAAAGSADAAAKSAASAASSAEAAQAYAASANLEYIKNTATAAAASASTYATNASNSATAASGSAYAASSAVTTAINNLNVDWASGTTSQTLYKIREVKGKIEAEWSDIQWSSKACLACTASTANYATNAGTATSATNASYASGAGALVNNLATITNSKVTFYDDVNILQHNLVLSDSINNKTWTISLDGGTGKLYFEFSGTY